MTRKRKRGAQPGNTNALRHGFYARNFSRIELGDLEEAFRAGLSDEITMLRVAMRRVFELATGKPANYETAANALDVLGLAATRLATLTRVQAMLGAGSDSAIATAIGQALSEIAQELKLQ